MSRCVVTFHVSFIGNTIFPELFMVFVPQRYLAVTMKQNIPRCYHWQTAPNPAVSWLL